MQIDSSSVASLAAQSSTSSSSGTDGVRVPQQTLGQQDFLNLLVTQLQNQDPMNPMSNTDFIAQMAQFSSLSTMSAMQSNVAEQQATELIGRNVILKDDTGNLVSGTVGSVVLDGSTPQLVVDGVTYGLSQLVAIVAPSSTSSTSTPSQ